MSARRGDDDGTTVEVVPLDPDAQVPAPGAAGSARSGERRPRGLHRAVVGLVVVAVTVGVAQVLEVRRDAERAAGFAAMSGTVEPIEGPFEATWLDGTAFSAYLVVGDLVVLARPGGGVRAVDPATGAEVWVLGTHAIACWSPDVAHVRAQHPRAVDDAPEDALVCRPPSSRAPEDEQRDMNLALVAGGSGEVLGDQSFLTPMFAPAVVGRDVVLVHGHRGRLVVTRTGLVDGTERWRREIPSARAGPGGQVTVRHGLVLITTSAVTVLLDADDGEVRGAWEAQPVTGEALTLGGPDVQVLREGYGVRVLDGEGRGRETAWHDHEGTPLAVLPGRVLEPPVTDGSDTGLVLSLTPDLSGLAATRPGGDGPLWTTSFRTGRALVARDGALVVIRGNEVVAVDLATGRERWSRFVAEVSPRSGAVTDGTVVVVVAERGRAAELVAIDLDDGALLWEAPVPTVPSRDRDAAVHDFPWVWLGELAGHAVVLSNAGITGLR